MKRVSTSMRLKHIMATQNLKQIDILNLSLPFCAKYDVKMNKSDISQYVSGKVEPSQEKLVILSMALNVTEAWLMGFDVEMQRTSTSPIGDAYMDMSKRIKERRKDMGYTQKELGELLGLQTSAIAKYENGRVENIKRSIIAKMAQVLNCSPCYLMGWEDTVQNHTPQLQTLIDKTENLNSKGMERLIEHADLLLLKEEYRKINTKEEVI